MMDAPLVSAVERYDKAVKALENAGHRISAEEILEILTARAQVQKLLNQKPIKRWIQETRSFAKHLPKVNRRQLKRQVKELDARLVGKVDEINQAIKLEDWNVLLPPSEREWLRLFAAPPRWTDRYDWLWQALTLIFLTISLSLLTPLIGRFFDGGPDQGVFAVIIPTVVGLLTGGALTRPGREAIEHVLTSLNLSKEWWDEITCATSLLLLISLSSFWNFLPTVSDVYEWFGDSKRCEVEEMRRFPILTNVRNTFVGQCLEPARQTSETTTTGLTTRESNRRLGSALKDYNRATKLYPDNANAYYKLGKVYQTLGRRALGNRQYEIAVGYSTNLKDQFAIDAFNTLITESAKNRNPEQARTWFEQCEERFPEVSQKQKCRLEDVAAAYLQKGKYSEVQLLLFDRLLKNRSPEGGDREDDIKQYRLLTYLAWAQLELKDNVFVDPVLSDAEGLYNKIAKRERELNNLTDDQKVNPISRCVSARRFEVKKEGDPDSVISLEDWKEIKAEWEQCTKIIRLTDQDAVYWVNLANEHILLASKRLYAMGVTEP
jgi:tetratricopeptide (TPR) repeat protein